MCHDSDSLKIAVYNTTFYLESELEFYDDVSYVVICQNVLSNNLLNFFLFLADFRKAKQAPKK